MSFALGIVHKGGNATDVVSRVAVRWAWNRANFCAVEEIKGNNTATATRRDPRKNEHVRVENCAGSDPSVRRLRVYV